MRDRKRIPLIVLALLLVGLLAAAGCGSTASQGTQAEQESQNALTPPGPCIEVPGTLGSYMPWYFDDGLNAYVIGLEGEGYLTQVCGAGFPPNETVDIYLDISPPNDISLASARTNDLGAFFVVALTTEQIAVAPDLSLDATWTCEPPLCSERITYSFRPCKLKAVVDGEVLAIYPMVAHTQW